MIVPLPDSFLTVTTVGLNGLPDKKVAIRIKDIQKVEEANYNIMDINDQGEVTSLNRLLSSKKLTIPTSEGILLVHYDEYQPMYIKGKLQ
jgi:hypothetical protein